MASSRGKPAYAAIMLALTLVIMAAIVGLLILQPETHNISRPSIRSIVDVFHAEGFSTMRRFDSTFDTTDPHEAFKPPADGDADAPAEPETEREEAVDDVPAAPDEASSDP